MASKNYANGLARGYGMLYDAVASEGYEKAKERFDKTCSTCNRYASDTSLKTTKNGKILTPEARDYYRGLAAGIEFCDSQLKKGKV